MSGVSRRTSSLGGQQKSLQTDRVILGPGPDEEIAVVNRIYRLGLLILTRLIWGPLYWPMRVANAVGFGWCASTAF